MPPQVQPLYAGALAKMRAWAEKAEQNALPADQVAQAIERALTSARPRTRYTVGREAFIGANVLARLPDRLRDRILGNLFR